MSFSDILFLPRLIDPEAVKLLNCRSDVSEMHRLGKVNLRSIWRKFICLSQPGDRSFVLADLAYGKNRHLYVFRVMNERRATHLFQSPGQESVVVHPVQS